jgi:hypothetical protein
MSFTTVSLALNIAAADDGCKDGSQCNPGGSYICTATTKGCADAGTCAGTSTVGAVVKSEDAAVGDRSLEARIAVEEAELASLRAELERALRGVMGGAGTAT